MNIDRFTLVKVIRYLRDAAKTYDREEKGGKTSILGDSYRKLAAKLSDKLYEDL